MTVTAYVFSSAEAIERDRLTLLSKLLDPMHRAALTAAGVGAGRRCLEVGAGVGTMSAWMADQVGPAGSVLATDVCLDFLDRPGPANLAVRRLDVVHDPLPENAFDIITARALLHHLPAWRAVVARLVRALKPGGRLVVVEPDATVSAANLDEMHERFWSAWCAWGREASVDFRIGHKIPAAFAAAGLAVDMSAMDVPFYPGGSGWSALYLMTLDAAGPRLTEAALPADLRREFRDTYRDPGVWMCSLGWIAVCGRKPRGNTTC